MLVVCKTVNPVKGHCSHPLGWRPMVFPREAANYLGRTETGVNALIDEGALGAVFDIRASKKPELRIPRLSVERFRSGAKPLEWCEELIAAISPHGSAYLKSQTILETAWALNCCEDHVLKLLHLGHLESQTRFSAGRPPAQVEAVTFLKFLQSRMI